MNHTVKQIKRMIIQGNYQFTFKAELELDENGLIIEDAIESLNAQDIEKVLNSNHPKTGEKEKLYIIKSYTYDRILIYTKGKIAKLRRGERFYILISSKKAI